MTGSLCNLMAKAQACGVLHDPFSGGAALLRERALRVMRGSTGCAIELNMVCEDDVASAGARGVLQGRPPGPAGLCTGSWTGFFTCATFSALYLIR